ncbi:DUF805 domain-containing protein [Lichenibacterium minor]|uniref:DUF805 domain-containing protein n=1 Tax=Lichenibacterium minor TaxID=2316528 RepID=UPI003D168FEC
MPWWRRPWRGLDPRGRTTVAGFRAAFRATLLAWVAAVAAMLFFATSLNRSAVFEIAFLLSLMLFLVASVLILSCIYVRRMRDAGLPTWLVLLPNLPTLSLGAYALGPRLNVSQQDVALACFLVVAPISWAVAGLLTLETLEWAGLTSLLRTTRSLPHRQACCSSSHQRPAATLASTLGAAEPDRGRHLAPVDRVKPSVAGEDGHGRGRASSGFR